MCRLLLQTGYDGSPEMYKKFEEALGLMKPGGPDNTTIIERDGILFGHNRLSIIDLSDEANQPFETEKCIVLFNGEIYNYEKARVINRLNCDTESDTEVIARMYEKCGMDWVKYLYGEYAVVIYDKITKSIYWVTDPSGIKPLYVNQRDDVGHIISSEQKAIKHLETYQELMIENWDVFLQFGYFDESPYRNISKVQKGQIRYATLTQNYLVDIWKDDVPEPRGIIPDKINPSLIRHLIENTVKDKMRSDVPIACALSGGIDSAIIAYLMRQHSPYRIKTYTIGFKGLDNEFDEAKRVADFLGTDHYEIEVDPKEILENIDDILDTMEEPVDRGSLIPTYFLAKHIKEKVILVGEGADEVFGGYKRHQVYMKHVSDMPFDEYGFTKKYYEMFDIDELIGDNHSYEEVDTNPMTYDLNHEIPYFHCPRIDKCFMRFGIEARVPYLDQLLIHLGKQIPFVDKCNPEKKILREAFRKKLPDWILDRPKKPLKLPFEYMIEMEEVKNNILTYENPWIKPEAIREIYESPPDSRNRGRKLWAIYLMNKWYEKQTRSNNHRRN